MKAESTFEVDGFLKTSEEDIFADGCQPDTMGSFAGDTRFTADSQAELIAKLLSFTCAKQDGVLVNSCEEKGRIDIQVMECEDGCFACKSEIEQWKKAEKRLWLSTYSFHVEKVTREKADLTD